MEEKDLIEDCNEKSDMFQLELVKIFVKTEDPKKGKKQTLCKFLLSDQGAEALVPSV